MSECVEEVACFKCSICGFLSLTSSDVHDHMRREHDLANISENTDVDWLEVAQRENIFLECPFCPNTFQKEGFRLAVAVFPRLMTQFVFAKTFSPIFNTVSALNELNNHLNTVNSV